MTSGARNGTAAARPKGGGAVMESRGRARRAPDRTGTPPHEKGAGRTADLDYYPTPPWATRALVRRLAAQGEDLARQAVLEPAAGGGWMARVLAEAFGAVHACDVADYGQDHALRDFTLPDEFGPVPGFPDGCGPDATGRRADWIITNPPFVCGQAFIERALALAPARGIAFLARLTFAEGGERYRSIFAPAPPAEIVLFCDRVAMVKNRVDRKASTATAYAWFVWRQPFGARNVTEFCWFPPGTRAACERDTDYPPAEEADGTGAAGPLFAGVGEGGGA